MEGDGDGSSSMSNIISSALDCSVPLSIGDRRGLSVRSFLDERRRFLSDRGREPSLCLSPRLPGPELERTSLTFKRAAFPLVSYNDIMLANSFCRRLSSSGFPVRMDS